MAERALLDVILGPVPRIHISMNSAIAWLGQRSATIVNIGPN
jgi:hypothetical protein